MGDPTDISALAVAAGAALAEELEATDEAAALSGALEALAAAYRSVSRPPSYGFEPAAAAAIRSEAERAAGAAGVERLNRLLLLLLIAEIEEGDRLRRVPASILPQLAEILSDILKNASRTRPGLHVRETERFRKDLGLCLLWMLPTGPELAEVNSGVPRRSLVGPPLGEVPSRLRFVLTRLGGARPLLVLHLDRRLSKHFSPEGYDLGYARLADILRARPDVKGVWSSFAWYLDPALDEVSPELAYLRRTPLSGGALLIPGRPDAQHTADATRWSPQRRRLFDEGRYRPVPHSWLWARKDLIRHVEARRASSSG